jgi:hypothetical protein
MLVAGRRHKYSKNSFKKMSRKNYSKKSKSKKNKHSKHSKRSRRNKSSRKQRGGSSELGSAYNAGGLLSTGYTLNSISPYDSALANPIPINTYSKCSS